MQHLLQQISLTNNQKQLTGISSDTEATKQQLLNSVTKIFV